jgi:flagellar biosynthesis component FlhA
LVSRARGVVKGGAVVMMVVVAMNIAGGLVLTVARCRATLD